MIASMRTNVARAHRVAVAVTEQAPIFELAVPCEVFGIDRPELADPWYDLQVCSVDPDTTVAAGFVASAAATMTELAQADTVIVPACASVHTHPPSALVEAVRDAYEAGARIAGICSGAFVLAAAGILDGRRATAHWMHADELAARHPAIDVDPSVLYVDDRGVFTSAGTAAGIDLCLELIRQDHGTAVVNALARRLIVPPHRDGGQAQYVRLPAAAPDDTKLAPLLDWARTHLHEPLTLDDLARHSHLSRRTLARRFHDALGLSPLRWLQHERLRHTQHLLETTTLPIDRIAQQAGLGSPTNLRRHFLDHLGISPQRYRHTFKQHTDEHTPNATQPSH